MRIRIDDGAKRLVSRCAIQHHRRTAASMRWRENVIVRERQCPSKASGYDNHEGMEAVFQLFKGFCFAWHADALR